MPMSANTAKNDANPVENPVFLCKIFIGMPYIPGIPLV